MNNSTDCEHKFGPHVSHYIGGDEFKECLECREIINVCKHERYLRALKNSGVEWLKQHCIDHRSLTIRNPTRFNT